MDPMTAMMLMQGLNMGVDYLTRPKNKMTAPNKAELTLSDADIAKMRNNAMGRINMMNTQNIAAIKQAGAANRMPSGAIASGVANAAAKAGQAISGLEGDLAMAKKGSMRDYYNLMNQYEQGQQTWSLGMHNRSMDNLGTLGKIGALWMGGGFNSPLPQTTAQLPKFNSNAFSAQNMPQYQPKFKMTRGYNG